MLRGTLLLVIVGIFRVWAAGPTPDVPSEPPTDEIQGLLAESAQAVTEQEERKRRFSAGETLDPNRASEIQLDRLPGVGPSLAQAIIEFREKEGPFSQASDLLAVRGVGPASLDRFTPLLDFSRGVPRRASSRRRSPRTGRVSPASLRPPAKLALNSASAEQLESVPGIGPVMARRILEIRNERGRFATLDDLLDVPGIGAKTLLRLRGHLRVGGRTP